MKKCFVSFCLATVVAVSQAQSLVASGAYGGHTYYVYDAPYVLWDDANAYANSVGSNGSHLATITDAGEDAFVGSLFGSTGLIEAWLGGFQDGTESGPNDGWMWVTGETWSYTNWHVGMPDDYYGPKSEERLGMWWLGTWNDERDNGAGTNAFIVETPVPEPASLAVLGLGLFAVLRRPRK